MMPYIPAHRDASNDPALRGSPLAVYDFLIYELEVYEWRQVKITGIALALRRKRSTIIRALRLLSSCGYLERGKGNGNRHLYRLRQTRRDDSRTNPGKVPLNGHNRATI